MASNRQLNLSCANVSDACEPVSLYTDMRFLTDPEQEQQLCEGRSLSSFVSFVLNAATEPQKLILEKIMNLSYYENEVEENKVPFLDVNDEEDGLKYTICIQKSMWLLPNATLENITAERFATFDYHQRCQPASCNIWRPGQDYEPEDSFTFRFTKTIISYIYDLTIQFRVTEIPESEMASLSEIDDIPIQKALLLERTKRDRTRQDSTKKVKSLLMFHQLDDGLLVSHITGVMNTSIPTIVASLLEHFHQTVADEVSETCVLTRQYFKQEFQ